MQALFLVAYILGQFKDVIPDVKLLAAGPHLPDDLPGLADHPRGAVAAIEARGVPVNQPATQTCQPLLPAYLATLAELHKAA